MKKILSVAMAAAMVASMATVAFAAAGEQNVVAVSGPFSIGDADVWNAESGAAGTDDKDETLVLQPKTGNIAYGSTVYYALSQDDTDATDAIIPVADLELANLVNDKDNTKSISVKQKWEMNGSAVEKIEVIKKKINYFAAKTAEPTDSDNKYFYFVAVKFKANETTEDTDVIGTVTIRKTGEFGIENGTESSIEIPVNVTLKFGVLTSASQVTSSNKNFDFGEGDVEDEIRFSKHENDYFIVDTCDQDDLVLKVTDTFNSEVAGKFPEANLHFFNGNFATFNRIGELTLAGCDIGTAKAVYAIDKDGVISAVKAEYDEYEEAFKVKTRTLGVYFLSDVELDLTGANTTVTPPETEDDTTTTTPNNPNTGAIA